MTPIAPDRQGPPGYPPDPFPSMNAWGLFLSTLLVAFLLFSPTETPAFASSSWPLWEAYKNHFLQRDGRVIDRTDHDRTTSEGEAYTLFLSLAARDKTTFRTVLGWIRNNLAQGDLDHRLPAWVWGKRPKGGWGVLDENSASDADCWIAYSLIEAGRLWSESSYGKEGRHLLLLISKNETRLLPGFGWVLLPGPWGFVLPDGSTRLNPSYIPPELLARFGLVEPGGPWAFIFGAFLSHLPAIAPIGLVPDWFAVRKGGLIVPDPVKGAKGGYDAIRVYLWAGLLSGKGPFRKTLLDRLGGMNHPFLSRRGPPLSVDTGTGSATGMGAPGFSAALLPYFRSLKNRPALARALLRLKASRHGGLYGTPPDYYDQVLALYGEGALDRRFAFDPEGRLLLPGHGRGLFLSP